MVSKTKHKLYPLVLPKKLYMELMQTLDLDAGFFFGIIMNIISRKEAIEANLVFYLTGLSCKNGHSSKRYTSSGHCVECRNVYNKSDSKAVYLSSGKQYKSVKKYRLSNKIKDIAHQEVKKAINNKTLIRPSICSECHVSCIPHGHHDDYSKPLKVKWLCQKCHAELHSLRKAVQRGL
jgi:hypothetical protein